MLELVDGFQDSLAELHFLSFSSQGQEKDAIVLADRKTEQLTKAKLFGLAIGARLTGVDPFSESGEHCSYGLRTLVARQLRELACEIHGRLRAQIICYAFEESERFFKNLGGVFYWQRRIAPESQRFMGNVKYYKGEQKGTAPFYAKYAEWECRSNC